MPDLAILLILLAVGYTVGTFLEKRHFRSIERRERELLHIPVLAGRALPVDKDRVESVAIATGSAVISVDYFKRFAAVLRNLFGGRMKTYETLLDRARREALLRMRQQVPDADYIINVRLATASISKSAKRKNVACVEGLAYGTALRLKSKPDATRPVFSSTHS